MKLLLKTPLAEMVATLVEQGNCQVLPVSADHTLWPVSRPSHKRSTAGLRIRCDQDIQYHLRLAIRETSGQRGVSRSGDRP